MHNQFLPSLCLLAAGLATAQAAEGEQSLGAVEITSSRESQLGLADSANEGEANAEHLASRVVMRNGEALEIIPGLIVSQHSGEGKANQYYLRGMNLDHGTDLRLTLDGMLINQRSHAHGQGWADLNFLIPELINNIQYKKGPYYANEGDFASAGAAHIRYADKLESSIVSVGLGQNGYARTLLAKSVDHAEGTLLYALDVSHYDGPWQQPDNYRKLNGMLRYSAGNSANGWNVSAMSYTGAWHSSDQIPQRAVQSGQFSRFGNIDTSDGANASRHSISGEWRQSGDRQTTIANAYLIKNYLDLYSNFTYFLKDPVHGDQFNQRDERVTTGFNLSHSWDIVGLGKEAINTIGLQLQSDNIHNGLYTTEQRQRLATTRADHVVESSAGLFFENHVHWSDTFRTVLGSRVDAYRFNVNRQTPTIDSIASPKLSLVFGPWNKTEYYINAGTGFHSNDARGNTSQYLVRAKGYEAGIRSEWIPGLQSTLSIFQLDFASELLFVGDAGSTTASRPSRRIGWEFNHYYKLNNAITLDADLAMTRARFKNQEVAGAYVPGAVEGVASIALSIDNSGASYGSLQLRYFGPRPLVEDNSVRSNATMTVNGRLGYRISKDTRLELTGFNLTDRKDPAVQYYYTSQLKTEANPQADLHFHPLEPRAFRVTLISRF